MILVDNVKPSSGYIATDVLVDGVSVGFNGASSSFVMSGKDVEVEVVFELISEANFTVTGMTKKFYSLLEFN